MNSDSSNIDFLVETTERYKLTVEVDNKRLINTSNSFEELKNIYDELVRDNITSDKHMLIIIYDYYKDADIEYYDSDYERC